MTASEMQQNQNYQASHKNMGVGTVRRMGVLYHFWDKEGREKGIINADDLSHITLKECFQRDVGEAEDAASRL